MSTTFDLSTLGLNFGTYSITVKAKGTYWQDSPASAAASYDKQPEVYSITCNLTNLTYFGDYDIMEGSTTVIRLDGGLYFAYPSTITVTGATYSYNSTTGAITLSNPTGDVTITAVGVRKAYPISVSLTNATSDSSNPTTIAVNAAEGECQLRFYPNTNFAFATAPTVTGAEIYGWEIFEDDNGMYGRLSLYPPTGNVSVTVVAEESLIQLATPSIEIDGDTLNIYDEEGIATSYDILVDGVVKGSAEVPQGYSIDFSGLTVNTRGDNSTLTIYDGQDANGIVVYQKTSSATEFDRLTSYPFTSGYFYITWESGKASNFNSVTATGGVTITSYSTTNASLTFAKGTISGDGAISGTLTGDN